MKVIDFLKLMHFGFIKIVDLDNGIPSVDCCLIADYDDVDIYNRSTRTPRPGYKKLCNTRVSYTCCFDDVLYLFIH